MQETILETRICTEKERELQRYAEVPLESLNSDLYMHDKKLPLVSERPTRKQAVD